MQTETDGIVLRHIKTAAGRTMRLIYTQKYGKISVGSSLTDKNSRSKSSLAIRPFTYGRYELYKGREIYNLNGGEVKKSFYSFGADIDKYINASVALELTEKVLSEDVPEPRVFSLLLDFLNALERRSKAFETLLMAYEVKLLIIMGHFPVLDSCVICGAKGPFNRPGFSVREGGLVCPDCLKKMSSPAQNNSTENIHLEGASRLIYAPKFDIVDTLRYFAEKPLSAFDNIALNKPTEEELKGIIREYYSYHLDVGPLKSESML